MRMANGRLRVTRTRVLCLASSSTRLDRVLPYGRVPRGDTSRQLSICGFPVDVAVHHPFEDPRGGRDLGHGWLQDRLLTWAGPGGERRAEVAVVRVFGRDRL